MRVEIVSRAALKDWIDRIIALDRANMGELLAASNRTFPEATRRAGLANPATEVVLVIDDDVLAGYVEVAPHRSVPGAVYVSSLQVAARYRGGGVLPRLLVEVRALLEPRRVTSIRSNVLRLNKAALTFFGRLGFEIGDATPHSASLEVCGGPELLASPLLARLSERHASRSAG